MHGRVVAVSRLLRQLDDLLENPCVDSGCDAIHLGQVHENALNLHDMFGTVSVEFHEPVKMNEVLVAGLANEGGPMLVGIA